MKIFFYRIVLFIYTFFERLSMMAYIAICKSQGMKIGKDVKIFGRVYFGSEPYLVEIGDLTQIANGTSFVNHGGTTKTLRRLEGLEDARIFGHIKIGKNCTIGSNCIIQQNVSIGDNCILGASSVLTHSMPDNSVFAGNLAKFVCSTQQYGESILENNTQYPRELENNRKELDKWLKSNLPHEYKPIKTYKSRTN